MNSLLHFVILALATWRISSLLCDEDGPWRIFSWIRNRVGVKYNEQNELYATNEIAKVFTCLWCMSYIVGIIVVLVYVFVPASVYVFAALAFSSISMLADKQLWRGFKKEGH